jgi:hypothetical protein
MRLIDTRLVQIDRMVQQYNELSESNPAVAAVIARKKNALIDEVQKDLAPLFARCKPWSLPS